jgi:inorganic phosphate transporter, PiT family
VRTLSAVARLITLPSAALMGALCRLVGSLVGGLGGALIDLSILCALALYIYLRSRRRPVGSSNVTADWEDGARRRKAGARKERT